MAGELCSWSLHGSLEFLSGLSPFPDVCKAVSVLEQRSPCHIRAGTGLSVGHKAVCVCHKSIELAVCSSRLLIPRGSELDPCAVQEDYSTRAARLAQEDSKQ